MLVALLIALSSTHGRPTPLRIQGSLSLAWDDRSGEWLLTFSVANSSSSPVWLVKRYDYFSVDPIEKSEVKNFTRADANSKMPSLRESDIFLLKAHQSTYIQYYIMSSASDHRKGSWVRVSYEGDGLSEEINAGLLRRAPGSVIAHSQTLAQRVFIKQTKTKTKEGG